MQDAVGIHVSGHASSTPNTSASASTRHQCSRRTAQGRTFSTTILHCTALLYAQRIREPSCFQASGLFLPSEMESSWCTTCHTKTNRTSAPLEPKPAKPPDLPPPVQTVRRLLATCLLKLERHQLIRSWYQDPVEWFSTYTTAFGCQGRWSRSAGWGGTRQYKVPRMAWVLASAVDRLSCAQSWLVSLEWKTGMHARTQRIYGTMGGAYTAVECLELD